MPEVIFALDSFKGSLSAHEAGMAAARGLRSVRPGVSYAVVGIADGGEGTLNTIVGSVGGELIAVSVVGPYGHTVEARYGLCGDMAVIEMAEAAGLTLTDPSERNPEVATSYGVGQLVADALGRGVRRFMIGLGGSATNDGGIGMLQALGYDFYDAGGDKIERYCGASGAGRVRTVQDQDVIPGVKEAEFNIACDVKAPLTGPAGATYVFGPQKGADGGSLRRMDGWLKSFARASARYHGCDVSHIPGTGAAGGLGFAFMSYLGASLRPGIDMVLDAIGFDDLLEDAEVVITGEGRLDRQTCMGKAPCGVLKRARRAGVPVIAVGGSVEPGSEEMLRRAGFAGVFPIVSDSVPLEEAMRPEIAAANVERTSRRIFRQLYNIKS